MKKRHHPLRVAVLVPEATSPLDEEPPPEEVGRGDEQLARDWPPEADEALLRVLRAEGFEPSVVGIGYRSLDRLQALEADVALNLCDGSGVDGQPGVEVIDALELRGMPYTGARRAAYWLGCDKVRMKLRFYAARVPTPAFQVMGDPDEALQPELRFPLFVKPQDGGGSVGIDLGSMVEDEAALRARLARVIPVYGPVLVEEYVAGREITVAILGDADGGEEADDLVVFPPLEVRFGAVYPEGRGVRTFQTKYDPDSPLYHGFDVLCPAPLEPPEEARVLEVARAAYRAIGGSGYGRVDMRLGPDGPSVLEVNPNCSLEWVEGDVHESGLFPIAAQAGGWTMGAVYRRLVDLALRRPVVQARAVAPRRRRRSRQQDG